jgi:hypothetical protein
MDSTARKELIKNMLQHFINDDTEKAKEALNQYLPARSREITGISAVSTSASKSNSSNDE